MKEKDICLNCPFFKNNFCKLYKNKVITTDFCVMQERKLDVEELEIIFHQHEKWRKGKGKKMINPKLLSNAIDESIRFFRIIKSIRKTTKENKIKLGI